MSTDPAYELYAPFAAGALGIVLAIGVLLTRSARRGWLSWAAALATLLGLAGTAAWAAYSRWPQSAWLPLAGLAGLWGVGLGLRTAAGRRALEWTSWVVVRPEFHALLLLVGGLGVIVAQSWRIDQSVANELDDTMAAVEFERSDIRPLPHSARTDLGSAVVLHAPSAPNLDAVDDRREREYMARRSYDLQLIRTGEARPECNCHGWVYTGGRFWIRSGQVDQILNENGYREVDEPRVGDLVIYRNEKGEVLHTGLVSSLAGDGSTLLFEGKWGRMGRFLHRPEDQPYGKNWKYYRSPRRGHLLQGLDKVPNPAYPLVAAGSGT